MDWSTPRGPLWSSWTQTSHITQSLSLQWSKNKRLATTTSWLALDTVGMVECMAGTWKGSSCLEGQTCLQIPYSGQGSAIWPGVSGYTRGRCWRVRLPRQRARDIHFKWYVYATMIRASADMMRFIIRQAMGFIPWSFSDLLSNAAWSSDGRYADTERICRNLWSGRRVWDTQLQRCRLVLLTGVRHLCHSVLMFRRWQPQVYGESKLGGDEIVEYAKVSHIRLYDP